MKKILYAGVFAFLIYFFAMSDPTNSLLFAGNIRMDDQIASKNLITTEGLRSATIEANQKKASDIKKIISFIEIQQVQNKISSMGFTVGQIKAAVRTLTNAELGYLARQAELCRAAVVGGDWDLTLFWAIPLLILGIVLLVYLLTDPEFNSN